MLRFGSPHGIRRPFRLRTRGRLRDGLPRPFSLAIVRLGSIVARRRFPRRLGARLCLLLPNRGIILCIPGRSFRSGRGLRIGLAAAAIAVTAILYRRRIAGLAHIGRNTVRGRRRPLRLDGWPGLGRLATLGRFIRPGVRLRTRWRDSGLALAIRRRAMSRSSGFDRT